MNLKTIEQNDSSITIENMMVGIDNKVFEI